MRRSFRHKCQLSSLFSVMEKDFPKRPHTFISCLLVLRMAYENQE